MKMIKDFFGNEAKLKNAFMAVKADMDCLEMTQDVFKDSANEWIMHLDMENKALKARLEQLEQKMDTRVERVLESNIEVLRDF
ncbi:MAG: hypothetical protein V1729_01255 [Candidatus Woesearchaeota archaeon]